MLQELIASELGKNLPKDIIRVLEDEDNHQIILRKISLLQRKDLPKDKYSRIAKERDPQKLLSKIIKLDRSSLVEDTQLFDTVMLYLSLSQKGLREEELIYLTQSDKNKLRALLEQLSPYITKIQKNWCIAESEVKDHFLSKLKDERRNALSNKIAEAIDQNEVSVLSLEEKVFQLYSSKDFSGLKRCLSDIENFLLLYNPHTKLDLFTYWIHLEIMGYEPVTEYVNSIEIFEMHVNPSSEDLFKIILQVSRFFKEIGDFEGEKVPDFWHPLILNKFNYKSKAGDRKDTEQLQLEDETATKAYFASLSKHYCGANPIEDAEFDDNADENSILSLDNLENFKKSSTPDDSIIDYLYNIGILEELEKFKLYDEKRKTSGEREALPTADTQKLNSLREFNSLNVKIDKHYALFRKYHETLLYEKETLRKEKMRQWGKDSIPCCYTVEEKPTSKEETDESTAYDKPEAKKDQNALDIFFDDDLMIGSSRESNFYHYKRWVWIMFPWACLFVQDASFSSIMSRCFHSATKYMSIKEEQAITAAALEIALEAKKSSMELLKIRMKDGVDTKKYRIQPDVKPEKSTRYSSKRIRSTKRLPNTESLHLPMLRAGEYPASSMSTSNLALAPLKIRRNISHNSLQNYESFEASMLARSRLLLSNTGVQSQLIRPIKTSNRLTKISEDRNKIGIQKSLQLLSGEVDKKRLLELKVLEKKVSNLKFELNQIGKERIAAEKKEFDISNLAKGVGGINIQDNTGDIVQIMNVMDSKLKQSESQNHLSQRIKNRMSMIIDLCDVNRNENHRFLDTLYKVAENYQISIKKERDSIRKMKSELLQMVSMYDEYKNSYKASKNNHISFMHQMSNIRDEERTIYKSFLNYDSVILTSIVEGEYARLEKEERGERNHKLSILEEQKQKDRKNKVKERLSLLKQRASEVKSTLSISPTEISASKYEIFLEKLEKKKELEQEQFLARDTLEIQKESVKLADYTKRVILLNRVDPSHIHEEYTNARDKDTESRELLEDRGIKKLTMKDL